LGNVARVAYDSLRMSTIDPEQERQRLAQLYRGMTGEQLQAVEQDRESLTAPAREALRNELANRHIAEEAPSAPPGSDEPERRDLVMIRSFRDLPEALLAKGGLESAGIECFLADENVVRLDWFWSNVMGGVKLLVDRENREAALAILDQSIPETLEIEGVGEYQQPHCPKCGSLDVSFEPLNEAVAYVSAGLMVPLPLHDKGWVCRACGHTWRDEEPADDAAS